MVASSLAAGSLLSRRRRAGDGRGRTDGVEVTQARARQSLQRATLFHTCSVPGGGFPLNEEEEEGDWLRVSLSLPPSLPHAQCESPEAEFVDGDGE